MTTAEIIYIICISICSGVIIPTCFFWWKHGTFPVHRRREAEHLNLPRREFTPAQEAEMRAIAERISGAVGGYNVDDLVDTFKNIIQNQKAES